MSSKISISPDAIINYMGIKEEKDVEKILSRFDITKEDIHRLQKLFLSIGYDKLLQISKETLNFISSLEETLEIVGHIDYETCLTVERIATHFKELLQGNYDLQFILKRVKVGILHDEVGVTPQLFSCTYVSWLINFQKYVENIMPPEEAFPIIRSLIKVATFDKTIVIEACAIHRKQLVLEKQQHIANLNRMLQVTYAISELILRANSIDELFSQTVKIIVTKGGFDLAWIGKVDPETKQIIPVASYGLVEYLDGIFVSIDPSIPEGRGPTGTAARTGKIEFINSLMDSERFLPWKDRASKFGICSSIAVPLGLNEVEAVLSIYSKKRDFFSQEELSLLSYVAGDIGYAMRYIAHTKTNREMFIKDILTGLYSVEYIKDWAKWFLTRLRQQHYRVVFVNLDISGLSKINSAFGFSTGDRIILEIAERLKLFCGTRGKVARVVGDEFLVVIPSDNGDISQLVSELRDVIEAPVRVQDIIFPITAFFGISTFPDDGQEVEDLIYKASVALTEAKIKKKHAIAFYSSRLGEIIKEEVKLEAEIHSGLRSNHFAMYLQPKIDLVTQKVAGFEALIRWIHPEKGVILPGRFIPFLERSGLIVEVGWWIIDEVFRILQESPIFRSSDYFLSFNVSIAQFESEGFIPNLIKKIEDYKVDTSRLIIEVTESLFITHPREMIEKAKLLVDKGLRLSIDDFGTGYSSLKYLKDIPASYLKIDLSFVRELPYDKTSAEIVKTILLLAKELKKKTVAEGVENSKQLRFLMNLGVDEAQGFYFAKPMPEEEIISWLETYNPERYFYFLKQDELNRELLI